MVSSVQDQLDLLSLRNSLLLYKALKKERVSECYISLDAFDNLVGRYNHFLRDDTQTPLEPTA